MNNKLYECCAEFLHVLEDIGVNTDKVMLCWDGDGDVTFAIPDMNLKIIEELTARINLIGEHLASREMTS